MKLKIFCSNYAKTKTNKHQKSHISSVAQSSLTLCDPMDYSTLGFLSITKSCTLLKLMSIESVMPSNHLILYHPLLFPPSIFPSIRVFSRVSSSYQVKYLSFSICPSNEYSGLISFRMDLFDLPAVQGTLKSLLQHHNSKASILWHNAGDLGLIPGLGRSPGEGKSYPLQYSGLENSMDCIVHGIAKSRTRLSNFHFQIPYMTQKFISLEWISIGGDPQ